MDLEEFLYNRDILELLRASGQDVSSETELLNAQAANIMPGVKLDQIGSQDILEAIQIAKQMPEVNPTDILTEISNSRGAEGTRESSAPIADPIESGSGSLIPNADSSIDNLVASVSNIEQLEREAQVTDFSNFLASVNSQNALDRSALIENPDLPSQSNSRSQLLNSVAFSDNPLAGFDDAAFEKQVSAVSPDINPRVQNIQPAIRANALRENRQNKVFELLDQQVLQGLSQQKQATEGLLNIEKARKKVLRDAAQVFRESLSLKRETEEGTNGRS